MDREQRAIEIAGKDFVFHVSGALYWPVTETLFVADLHLGKGAAFAERGTLLPPYDTRATLAALSAVIARFHPRRVICLGDSFQDGAAAARMDREERAALRRIVEPHEWIWIAGNHDPDPPVALGGVRLDELAIDGVLCRHQAGARAGRLELSGHFHPKASLSVAGRRITRPCFMSDGRRVILPAFGAYTGGLNALDPDLSGLFPHGFHAFVLGRRAVHRVPSDRLARSIYDRAVQGRH